MKSIFELIKQDEFTKKDLQDILVFCKNEGDLSPLCAVAYISAIQEITKEDVISLSKILDKYPELAIKFSD